MIQFKILWPKLSKILHSRTPPQGDPVRGASKKVMVRERLFEAHEASSGRTEKLSITKRQKKRKPRRMRRLKSFRNTKNPSNSRSSAAKAPISSSAHKEQQGQKWRSWSSTKFVDETQKTLRRTEKSFSTTVETSFCLRRSRRQNASGKSCFKIRRRRSHVVTWRGSGA